MVEVNQRYGKLITIEVVGKTKQRCKIWKCLCDCGNYIDVSSTSLSSGNTKSCGCLHSESMKEMGKNIRSLNDYIINDDICVGYTSDGEEFYFDKEDYDLIKNYTWSINDQGYVITVPFGKPIRMHILIMNRLDANDDKDIDHINHNRKDNRKENLRIVEHFQNITYCKTYSNNTSGRKGVYWDKSRNKWMACITYNNKTYYLGRYDSFEEAVSVREKAEKEIHKEFHYEE